MLATNAAHSIAGPAPSRIRPGHTKPTYSIQGVHSFAKTLHMVSSPYRPLQLTNPPRYLYETGNVTTAVQLLQFAYKVIEEVALDKTSEFYADLQYKAGSVYMDSGYLVRCREVWEEARHILEAPKAAGSASAKRQLTWLLMAMGNLETADGNYDTALKLFTQSDQERMIDDKNNLWRHGLSSMNCGRLHFFMGNYDSAMENYKECEKVFIPRSSWMAW